MREGVAEEGDAIVQHIACMLVDTMLAADTMLLRHRKTRRRYACAGIVVPANVERLASTICAIALLCPNKLTLSLPVV